MTSTISTVFWCGIQVTVLSMGSAIIYLIARRVHPRAGAAAASWGLVVVLLLTAFAVSAWPRWSMFLNATRPVDTLRSHELPADLSERFDTNARGTSDIAEYDVPSNTIRTRSLLTLWNTLTESLRDPQPAESISQSVRSWPMAIAGVLALGMAIAAARLIWAVVMVRRLAKSGRPINSDRIKRVLTEFQSELRLKDSISMRETHELATPATVGWRKPIVLLPLSWESWSECELRSAIAHELAHVARRDYAIWLIARLAVVAHYYHPVVRWLAARLQLEQELAADLTAASLVGDRKQYLRSLASLALVIPPHRAAGPARTLIPSQSLLVRRVEMLRNSTSSYSPSHFARYATMAIVVSIGIAAAGLRGPGRDLISAAQAQKPSTPINVNPVERIGLEIVPEGAVCVLSVRPAILFANPELRPFSEQVNEFVRAGTGVGIDVTELAEFLWAAHGPNWNQHRVVLRFQKASQLDEYRLAIQARNPPNTVAPIDGYEIWHQQQAIVRKLDENTLVLDSPLEVGASSKQLAVPPLTRSKSGWEDSWSSFADRPAVFVVDIARFRESVPLPEQGNLIGGVPLQMIAPVYRHAQWALASVDFKDSLSLSATLHCDSPQSAENISSTLQAASVLLQNVTQEQARRAETATDAFQSWMSHALKTADTMLKQPKFTVEGQRVDVSLHSRLSLTDLAKLAKSFVPSVAKVRQSASQNQSMNNLKQLAIAMLNFESTYKSYPAALGHKPKGKNVSSQHPYSWRVAVLPFLERQDLYEQYNFDEPWDSESNKKVLAQMPDVFRSPFDDPSSTNTSYFVFTGPGTMFEGDVGIPIRKVTDGTSKTILLVEAKQTVPWTKPEDIDFSTELLSQVGGWVPNSFLIALCDGSVHPVSKNVDEKTLRDWIIRSDGVQADPLPTPADGR